MDPRAHKRGHGEPQSIENTTQDLMRLLLPLSVPSGTAKPVRAFLSDQTPAAGARMWLVSTAGGRWSHDGKELYG